MVQLSKIVQLGGVPPEIPIFGNNFLSAAKMKQFQLEIQGGGGSISANRLV